MAKKKTAAPEPELAAKLKELAGFIEKNPVLHDRQGTLMAVLHHTQESFGYIPREAIDLISGKLAVPTAHLYGMATFYNFFSLRPKARNQVHLCKGTACYVSGGARVLDKVRQELGIDVDQVTADGLFGISITRCLGCCGLSPVMQVNKDIHVRMVPEKVPAILAKYRKKKASPGAAKRPGAFEKAGL